MRYLGIDYGAKRIGLAVSSEDIAFPLGILPNDSKLFRALGAVIAKEKIVSIVVGDTRSYRAKENPVTKEAEAFVERLKRETGLSVTSAWEAGSSVEASRYSPTGGKRDDAAAAIILQRYLDFRK